MILLATSRPGLFLRSGAGGPAGSDPKGPGVGEVAELKKKPDADTLPQPFEGGPGLFWMRLVTTVVMATPEGIRRVSVPGRAGARGRS